MKGIAIAGLATVVFACLAATAALDVTVKWSVDLTAQNLVQSHHSSPNVCDVDGDGKNEILFVYRQTAARLVCFKDDGSVKWFYPPLGTDPIGQSLAKPTIADINKDGKLEVLIGGRDRMVYCVSNAGQLIWKYGPTGESIEDTPEAYDVNGDGYMEIFFPEDDRHIYALDYTGKLFWKSPEAAGSFECHPTVFDVDRDGVIELIAPCQDTNIYCYNALTGQEKWRFPTGAKFQSNTAIVADVNKDGEYEILCPNDEGKLYCVSYYGTEVSHWTADTQPGEERFRFDIPLGDIDNDGHMDTVLMSNYMAYCVDCFTGKTKWKFKPAFPAHWGNYHVLGDVTGDGQVDVVMVAPLLYVLDNKGAVQATFNTTKLRQNDRAESGVCLADVDKDGKTEILFKFEGDKFYCVTLGGKYDAAKMPWPQMQQNSRNWCVIPIPELVWLAPLLLVCAKILTRRN